MDKPAKGFPPVINSRNRDADTRKFSGRRVACESAVLRPSAKPFLAISGAVIDEPLAEMIYERRLHVLLQHRIGLWDIIDACVRAGSLDSNIRDSRHNDFERVTSVSRNLRRVCFNGQTAGRVAPLFAEWGYETLVLPSSSPAYTIPFGTSFRQWKQITPRRPAIGGTRPSDVAIQT